MVRYFIGVYIINRTLHGRLEIRNFSSRVKKYFLLQHSKRKISVVSDMNYVSYILRNWNCLMNISMVYFIYTFQSFLNWKLILKNEKDVRMYP